jgi:hypothetical protein
MPFELTIAEGKGRGQRFEFEALDVTIGRGVENDVVLNDAGVSRNHARIKAQGQQWILSDNGSSNGTELNGAVIARATQLRTGDRIGVGPITFRFESRNEPAPAVRAAPALAAAPSGEQETRITSLPKQAPAAPRNEETRVSSLPAQGEAKAVAPQAGKSLTEPGLAEKFAQLPAQVRYGIIGGAAVLFLVVSWAWARGQKQPGQQCPEVVAVDDDTAGFSFGRGVVDVDCGDAVAFGFNAPPKTKVLFHSLATKVSSASEVELKLNGKHLSWAPVSAGRGEVQVTPITPEQLSETGRNVLTFVQSQKGKEWGVGKVRVEFLAVTPGDLKAAQAAYDRGRRKLEERRVAPRNLFDAWKYFTTARRSLEGLTPRPALYDEVAQLIKDAERDLDKECQRLMFAAAKEERYGRDEKAQQIYREVLNHFPAEDPIGCRKKAQANIVSTPVGGATE